MSPIEQILILLASACLMVPLLSRLSISPVLGYLVIGMLIGPFTTGIISDIDLIVELGDYGIVFLLFVIALELSIRRLKVMRRIVFGLGTLQVVVTATVLWIGIFLIGLEFLPALFLSFGFTLSSTAVVLNNLVTRGEMTSHYGRTCLGILLFQDLAILPLIAILPLLDSSQNMLIVTLSFIAGIGILLLIVMLGHLLINHLLHLVTDSKEPGLFTAMTLLIILGIGWITEQVGLSMVIGAFFAGLAIAETEFRHQIKANIEPFRDLLLALFFMTVGMRIDLVLIASHWLLILSFVGILVVIKAMIMTLLCRLLGHSWSVGVETGLSLAQGGEFGFILFSLAHMEGFLTSSVMQLAVATVGVTIAVTPGLLISGKWIARRLAAYDRSVKEVEE